MALSRPDRDFERICVLCVSLRPLRFIFSEGTTASVRAALAIKENAKDAKDAKATLTRSGHGEKGAWVNVFATWYYTKLRKG
jgi:hypothetical protein